MERFTVLQLELTQLTRVSTSRMREREEPRMTCQFLSEQPSGC